MIRATEGIGAAGSFAEHHRAGNAERDTDGDIYDVEHERDESARTERDGSCRGGAGDGDQGKEREGRRRPQRLDRFIRESDHGLHDGSDEKTGADSRDRRPDDGFAPQHQAPSDAGAGPRRCS